MELDDVSTSRPGVIVDYSDSSESEEESLGIDNNLHNIKRKYAARKPPDTIVEVDTKDDESNLQTSDDCCKLDEPLHNKPEEIQDLSQGKVPDFSEDLSVSEAETAKEDIPFRQKTIKDQCGSKTKELKSPVSFPNQHPEADVQLNAEVGKSEVKESGNPEDQKSKNKVDLSAIVEGLEKKFPINYKADGVWHKGCVAGKMNDGKVEVIDLETEKVFHVPNKHIKPWSSQLDPDKLNILDGVCQPPQSKSKPKYDVMSSHKDHLKNKSPDKLVQKDQRKVQKGSDSFSGPKSNFRGDGNGEKRIKKSYSDLREGGILSSNHKSEICSDKALTSEMKSLESSVAQIEIESIEATLEHKELHSGAELVEAIVEDEAVKKTIEPGHKTDKISQIKLFTIPEENLESETTVVKEKFPVLTIPETEVRSIEEFFTKYHIRNEEDSSKVLSQDKPRKAFSSLVESLSLSDFTKDDMTLSVLLEFLRKGDGLLKTSVKLLQKENVKTLASKNRGSQVTILIIA